MANVNLALDDIITKQKKTNRRGIGRKFGVRKAGGRLMNKRNGGSFGREKYFSEVFIFWNFIIANHTNSIIEY